MGFLIVNHDADGFHQEIYIRDLNLEFTNLKLTENVTSAQVATTAMYKDWQEIKLAKIKLAKIKAEITPQNRLTSFLFSSTRTQEKKSRSQIDQQNLLLRSRTDKQRGDEETALQTYYNQGEPRSNDY